MNDFNYTNYLNCNRFYIQLKCTTIYVLNKQINTSHIFEYDARKTWQRVGTAWADNK